MVLTALTFQKTDERKRRWRPKPGRRTLIILLTALAAGATYFLARGVVNELAARALAIFVIAAIFWATEVLPLFATAFGVVVLEVFFLATDGGLAGRITQWMRAAGANVSEHPEIDYTVFFSSFAQDIIMLFMGGFLLSAAVVKHGVDRAIASRVLGPFMRSPMLLVFGVMVITAFFSMWMSNTATAAMMVAIIGPIVNRLPRGERFATGLVLAVAFAANIGGIGTPIGTPPNAIAYGALYSAGFEVTFLRWMLVTVPLAIVLLVVVGGLLYAVYKPHEHLVLEPIEVKGRISTAGWVTIGVLIVTIGLWLSGGWHGMRPGAVALVAAAALSAFGVLERRDVDSIDWNILILMWGGLSLSVAMRETGLADVIAGLDVRGLGASGPVIAAVVLVAAAGISTFMSNTATAGLLVPMALALSLSNTEQYAMLAALGCSFAMAMPVSTPPNAIAYSTGHVPVKSMIRMGSAVTICSIVVVLMAYQVMLPLVFK